MLNKMRYKCDPHKHAYKSTHKGPHAGTHAIYIHTEIEIGAHSVTNILVVYGGLFGAKNTHSNRTQTEFRDAFVVVITKNHQHHRNRNCYEHVFGPQVKHIIRRQQ